jgi:AraC-like DNA-binding protein
VQLNFSEIRPKLRRAGSQQSADPLLELQVKLRRGCEIPSRSFPREPVLRTRDPEKAASELRSAAIPYVAELIPGSPPFSTQIRVIEGQRTCLSWVVTTGAMRVRSRLPGDSFAVIMDMQKGAGLHRCAEQNVIVNSDFAFVQSPLQSVEVFTPASFEVLFLRLAGDRITRELEKLLGQDVRGKLVFTHALPMQSVAGARLRDLCTRLASTLCRGRDPMIRNSLSVIALEEEMIRLLLLAQPHNYTRLLHRGTAAGDWQLRAAEEYMRDHAHLPLSLGDLCVAAGLNARTLQYSFRKKRGCSPMQFLRQVRMAEVRAGLLRPGEDSTVTSEAAHWGFVHFGRFSREYQRAFGELPSETLRRARKVSTKSGSADSTPEP